MRLPWISARKTEWEPVISSVPIADFLSESPGALSVMMRKRGSDGHWLYRQPTQSEIEDYLAAEAW